MIRDLKSDDKNQPESKKNQESFGVLDRFLPKKK